MKQLLLFLLISLFNPLYSVAQVDSIPSDVKLYIDYCRAVKEAIRTNNVDSISECALSVGGSALYSRIYFKGQELDIRELMFHDIETSDEGDYHGHILFTPGYVKNILIYGTNYRYDESAEEMGLSMRGVLTNGVQVAHKVIKARGRCVYSLRLYDYCCISMIAENKGRIRICVDIPSCDIHLSSVEEGQEECVLSWNMPRGGTCMITIENKGEMDTSYALISN